ncbi:MAG: hypothetical protein ABW128_24105, partial [Rhizorhabdus sp.]
MTALNTDVAAPPCPDRRLLDFVVVDVETACSRVSSICQIGIVGFRSGVEYSNTNRCSIRVTSFHRSTRA